MRTDIESQRDGATGGSRWAMAAAAVMIGAAMGVAFGARFLHLWFRHGASQAAWLFFLTLAFGGGLWILWHFWVRSYFRGLSKRARVWWIIGSGLGAVLLMLVSPVLVLPVHRHVRITALGERNPAAAGSEVWVTDMHFTDGTRLWPKRVRMKGDWQLRDGIPESSGHPPATITWEGNATGKFAAGFLAHQWSGMVEVECDGAIQRVDLYAAAPTSRFAIFEAPIASMKYRVFEAGNLIAEFLAWAAGILTAGLILAYRPARGAISVKHPYWNGCGYFVTCTAVWSLYLLAFWPGMMSPDSVDQWHQAATGVYDDAHPAFHTMMVHMLQWLWPSPAVVCVAQIASLAAVAAWGLVKLRRLGLSPWATWILCVLFAVSPPNGAMVVVLWKDIPYSIALLGLSILLFEVAETRGASLATRWHWIALGLLCPFIIVVRHNGFFASLVTLGVLVLCCRGYRRFGLASLLVTCVLWAGVKGPLYRVMKVSTQGDAVFHIYPILHHLAAHLAAGTPLSPKQRELLNLVHPVSDHWLYSPYTVGTVWYDKATHLPVALAHESELRSTLIHLFLKRPMVDIVHQFKVSSAVWELATPADGYYGVIPLYWDEGSLRYITRMPLAAQQGLEGAPRSMALFHFFSGVVTRTMDPRWISWIWRTAGYLYLSIGCVVLWCIRRRSAWGLLVLVPVVSSELLLIPAAMEQAYRHHYPVYLFAFFAVGLLFSSSKSAEATADAVPKNSALPPDDYSTNLSYANTTG